MADSQSSQTPLDTERTNLQNQAGQLDPKQQINSGYRPNKRRRAIRREVYQRYYWLRDDPLRTEAEADWELADKEFSLYVEPKDADDWHADLHLPDAFAAIQTQAQETIERRSRPTLRATEESDEPISEFANSVINYNMDNTGYDYQYYLAKLAASSRGTAFLMDYWRHDRRVVKDPDSIDQKTGEIKYKDKELIDFDDDYTEWVPNEFIYIDDKAKHIDEAVDMVRRQILNIEEFHRIYDQKPGFFDTEYVYAGGDTSTRSFFQIPHDITAQDVEVLHYYNRSTDAYWVVANNVCVHDSPLPWKHKELPVAVLYQYRVPGRFWGIGIPKVIHYLSEERRTIRNLNLDRQKLQINKMFLHNNAFDLDDEDLVSRPGGMIDVDTNGQPVNNAIVPLEYGDVPASYFRTEEVLLEDIRRAHGIDDRVSGAQIGSTATEAALRKESAIKRINLISITAEMDAVVRIGRLKWSNIQFFYGVPRMQRITEDNEEREEKVYKTISISGKRFSIKKGEGGPELEMDDVTGATGLTLNKDFAKYLDSSFDITVDAEAFTPISKAIQQTKVTELFSLLLSNPTTLSTLDINGSVARLLTVNDEQPEVWMKANAKPERDMMLLAEAENMIMAAGQPLAPTENASADHTLIHLVFTKSADFQVLSPQIQALFEMHILGEHDNNPSTGPAAELLGAAGQAVGAPGAPGQGQIAPLNPGAPQTSQPQNQVADLQPTNFAAPES